MIALVDLINNKGEYTSEQVLDTFKDYSESGAPVLSSSIKLILGKYPLTADQLRQSQEYMIRGELNQWERGFIKDAQEYRTSFLYMYDKLRELGTKSQEDEEIW